MGRKQQHGAAVTLSIGQPRGAGAAGRLFADGTARAKTPQTEPIREREGTLRLHLPKKISGS